jgi:hypothetical protein
MTCFLSARAGDESCYCVLAVPLVSRLKDAAFVMSRLDFPFITWQSNQLPVQHPEMAECQADHPSFLVIASRRMPLLFALSYRMVQKTGMQQPYPAGRPSWVPPSTGLPSAVRPWVCGSAGVPPLTRPGVFRTVLVMVDVVPSGLTRVSVVIVSSMMDGWRVGLLLLSVRRYQINICSH